MSRRKGSRLSKTPAPRANATMSVTDYSHMRHRHYIVRTGSEKTCVPMIAIDELPAGLKLRGMPMTVTPQQIQEWDMTRVGADVKLNHIFKIDSEPRILARHGFKPTPDKKQIEPLKPDEAAKDAVNESSNAENETSKYDKISIDSTDSSEKSTIHDKPEHSHVEAENDPRSLPELQQQANNAANEFVEQTKQIKDFDSSKTQDAATPGIYGKKKFCTHWIRTGNCDYMQEGCRYLHVIPDAETRLRIGIRDMPRWAKEDLPSPPRETHGKRRYSSSSPRDSKKFTQKDWRHRGNRKAHDEVPAGPPSTRPFLMRSQTPTPQPAREVHQRDSAHASLQMQGIPPFEKARVNIPAAPQNHRNPYDLQNAAPTQQGPLSIYDRTTGPYTMQPAATTLARQHTQIGGHQDSMMQGTILRQNQMSPLLSNSSPLPLQPPTQAGFYGNSSYHHPTRHGFRPTTPVTSYSTFGSHLQPPVGPSYTSRDIRSEGGHWVQPSYQTQGATGHQLMQPQFQPNPAQAATTSTPWLRGPVNSPAPSFSDASIGTIGHGRPTNNPSPFSPPAGPPIMHKRLFRQPGEAEYVQARPEPKTAMSRAGSRSRSHQGHGKGISAHQDVEQSGGRSGQVGNLIALDE